MMGRSHLAAGALFTAAFAPPISNALGLDLSPYALCAGVGIGTIAGMLPDIDHPESLITKGVMPGTRKLGAIGKALGWYLSIPPRVVGLGARATMNHRGGTHSALFMVLWSILAAPLYALTAVAIGVVLSIILAVLSPIIFHPIFHQNVGFTPTQVIHWFVVNTPHAFPLIALCVFLGYLAHLVTDSMTKVPVPWPWPFSKRRLWILPKPFRITTDSFVENHFIRPALIILAVAAFIINIGIPMINGTVRAGEQATHSQTTQTLTTPSLSSIVKHLPKG